MFKIINFAYRMGRKQAYSEVISKLERLAVKLPHDRTGQSVRKDIDATVAELQTKLNEEAN